MKILAQLKKMQRKFIRYIAKILLKDTSTLYKPFLGYDYLKTTFLIARDQNVIKFDRKVMKSCIKNYITFASVIPESQTMVKESHLGGYVHEGARGTYNPLLWSSLIELLNVQSVFDIGCGRGFSLVFFFQKVPFVVGVEGSAQAIETSLIPENTVQHDYIKGPSSVSNKFDLAWCCEVVEHIEEEHVYNLITDFKKSRFLAITYAVPGQGGHHHVNEQFGSYWIRLLSTNGFFFCKNETEIFRNIALLDELKNKHYNHFAHKGLFFINKTFDL